MKPVFRQFVIARVTSAQIYQDSLKRQKSGLWPILQPRKEGPEGRHSQVKAGRLRAIQSKDKVVLDKDRPGHESQNPTFLCLFWKANMYPGKHKIQNRGPGEP